MTALWTDCAMVHLGDVPHAPAQWREVNVLGEWSEKRLVVEHRGVVLYLKRWYLHARRCMETWPECGCRQRWTDGGEL